MDSFSHGLWSYVLFRGPIAWLAVLAGVLPDVVALGPRVVANAFKGRLRKGLLSRGDGGLVDRYTDFVFPLTHSLVVAAAVITLVFIFFGAAWWLLAWPLHIMVDMFTHKRSEATPFLYPLSGFRFSGIHWSSAKFLLANNAGLAVVYGVNYLF